MLMARAAVLPVTAFESITADTPIEGLNLNWTERDLPQSVRTKHVHALHPYLGKFVPQLVEIFPAEVSAEACYRPLRRLWDNTC